MREGDFIFGLSESESKTQAWVHREGIIDQEAQEPHEWKTLQRKCLGVAGGPVGEALCGCGWNVSLDARASVLLLF